MFEDSFLLPIPIFVFVFFLFSIIFSIVQRKRNKKKKEEKYQLKQKQLKEQNQKNIDKVVTTIKAEINNALDLKKERNDNLITCPYCSGIYKKEELKCPNCGATTKN